jgi:hypothetical protein
MTIAGTFRRLGILTILGGLAVGLFPLVAGANLVVTAEVDCEKVTVKMSGFNSEQETDIEISVDGEVVVRPEPFDGRGEFTYALQGEEDDGVVSVKVTWLHHGQERVTGYDETHLVPECVPTTEATTTTTEATTTTTEATTSTTVGDEVGGTVITTSTTTTTTPTSTSTTVGDEVGGIVITTSTTSAATSSTVGDTVLGAEVLPFTGLDTGALALFAASTVALGLVLIVGSRREESELDDQRHV